MGFTEALERKKDNYIKKLEEREIRISADRYLADAPTEAAGFKWPMPDTGWDNQHFPLDYGLLLREGIPGIIRRAEEAKPELVDEQNALRLAVAEFYRAFSAYIGRNEKEALRQYDDNNDPTLLRTAAVCRALQERAPETFLEGIQLVWFVFQIRGFYRSSLGRMDVFLWPLYEKDILANGKREEAFRILEELWINFNIQASGDTLMNLMLGGVDAEGRDVSNNLSLLIMEVAMKVRQTEPHLNIRLHDGTSEAFLKKAAKLVAMGQGQGVVYMDKHLIPAMVNCGIPLEYARNYANDGCTEITFNGDSAIWFFQMEMMKSLELALFRGQPNPATPRKETHKWNVNYRSMIFESQLKTGFDSGDPLQAESFEALYDIFIRQLDFQLEHYFSVIDDSIIKAKEDPEFITSLLVSGLCERTLDTGIDPAKGGYKVDNYQLLSGSIPTVADALYALKTVVFDEKLATMPEILEAITTDYEGREPLRQMLLSAPKFGNDSDDVDSLAAAISEHFLEKVETHRSPYGVRILPGIYNIDFHMMAMELAASPDGRKNSDLIADHYSPTPGRAVKGPLAVLSSCSKGHLERGCASSPIQLALPRTTEDEAVSYSMLKALSDYKLPVVSLTFQDVAELRDAQIHPEAHQDLVVRVWGFNARFVELEKELQDHIIMRTLGK